QPDFKYVSEKQKEFLLKAELATMSVGLARNTGIHLTSYTRQFFTEEENAIVKRFAKVFDQAYTRFLDLQKAEEQTREARIETAVERVRAVAMAMRTADDLPDICEMVYSEFQSLGFSELRNTMVNIHNDEKEFFLKYDYAEVSGKTTNRIFYNAHPTMENLVK